MSMKDDIKAQLDFLKSARGRTIRDVQNLVLKNNLELWFCHELNLDLENMQGLKEQETEVYIVTTLNKEVVAIGGKNESEYLYQKIEEFLAGEVRTIGEVVLVYYKVAMENGDGKTGEIVSKISDQIH